MTQKYLLNNIKLTNADCDQLVDRMVTPQVQFENQEESLPKEAATKTSDEPVIETYNLGINKKFIVLIPNDIFEAASDKDLKKIVGQTLNGELVEKIRIDNMDTAESQWNQTLFCIATIFHFSCFYIFPAIQSMFFIK